MGVSKFVLKLRLYKDEQKSEIFCSSFESTRYRIPSNIKLTFRTFTVFSPKTPKKIVHQKDTDLCCPFWIGFHIMLQKLLVQTYHFLSGKEKDASHIL